MTAGGDGALELAVRDTGSRHAGRNVAQLPERARRALGVLSGDTVVIEGARESVATVWPAGGDVPADAVALDAYTRDRAGAAVGSTVAVRSARLEDATVVTVKAPADASTDAVEAAVQRALRDRPVAPGDRVALDDASATVLETRPAGAVRFTDDTAVRVRRATGDADERRVEPAPGGVTYDDIGGLDEELALVRETIELPLAEPELFDRLGVEPPAGVLLYGPPGTGKTLIAEAVANAVDATVYHVSGPEILSKYKGESEERLREVFERARDTAPSIVFFDEIDAIGGKRETGADMESRVVAQLLSLMDGLTARGQVIVIGATNRVDTLDPALRRAGRFDREIEIGVPDRTGRREILAVHVERVPLADDVDLDRLADRTHGFVGADLEALVTEAAMAALRRVRATDATATDIEVTRADVETAMASVDPSAMREFVAELPATSFDDVGDLESAKAALRESIEWPLAYPELFEATGIDPPGGILLYGPPGTGKTLLARAAAHESGVNVIHVAGPELIDKYVGESERAVRDVFERARQTAPTIVFFDEIDAIAGRRVGDDDVTERVVSQLLTELDGVRDNPHLVVLAATNRRHAIDPALLRPGRLEAHVEVPPPDAEGRRDILRVHTRDVPVADVDLDALADELDGATGADLAALVRDASMRAIREAVDERGAEAAVAHADEIRVRGDHFRAARYALDGNGDQ